MPTDAAGETKRADRSDLNRIPMSGRGSVAQLVIERLDGTYDERNEVGQYPLYNSVGGVVVTGNEDGAHSAAESTLFNLSHLERSR